ncbi:MAG: hypothetical protein GY943_27700 [Chloroflexi bacterium]|nr:hypothetical protein [Chloroflexota bacterium]
MDEFLEIFEQDLSEAEKIAASFDWITGRMVLHATQEIELLRVTNAQDALVKEQIKLNLTNHIRGIFEDCYKRATGDPPWD